MDRDEMLRLWRGPADPDDLTPEEVVMQVKQRARKLDRSLFWLEVREVAAGLLAVGVMGWVSFTAPGWTPKAGALALAVCVVYTLARLLAPRRRERRLAEDVPLAERLRAEIDKVETQIRLLSTVRTWYVLPLAIGGTLWLASMVPALGLPLLPSLAALAFAVVASGLIFWVVGFAVVWLNRRAVKKGLSPYRDELQELLSELASS